MSKSKSALQFCFQVVLPVAFAGLIGWYFYGILRKLDWEVVLPKIHWLYLLPASLLYLCCHTLWGLFWVSLLRNQGIPISTLAGLRSYFFSQFGKYLPGKIWVIVIRVAMLGKSGANKIVVALTATMEALTSMASGAFLGVMILPLLESDRLSGIQNPILWLMPIGSLPIMLILLNRLIVRIATKRRDAIRQELQESGTESPPEVPLPKIGFLILLQGFFQTMFGWLFLGLSFWLIIEAVEPRVIPVNGSSFLRLTGINCLSYVLGFVALFMPAGGGVREIVIQLLLAKEFEVLHDPDTAAGLAAMIAILVRLVWTTAEIILALSLRYGFSERPLPMNDAAIRDSK